MTNPDFIEPDTIGERDFCPECEQPVIIEHDKVHRQWRVLQFDCGHIITIDKDY
jgi:hypothetical protein